LPTTLTLFRGIAVPASRSEDITRSILANGIRGDEGGWRIPWVSVRPQLDALFRKQDLAIKDTRPTSPNEDASRTVCACGDRDGAAFYALEHNRHTGRDETPLVIEIVAPAESVAVDGRDFLYTCFQLWDRSGPAFREKQEKALTRVFGPAVLRYFRAATTSRCQEYRIAMCDLACADAEVVHAHARNRIALGGRHGTRFHSAFKVRAPIESGHIAAIYCPCKESIQPAVTYDGFVEGDLDGALNG